MYNPLALLTQDLLQSMIEAGHKYFVRQSYLRGKDGPQIEAFLFSSYRDFTSASAHYEAIKFDSRKYLYDLSHSGEREKLDIAASQPENYRVFINVLKEERWQPPAPLVPQLKKYIRHQTNWSPNRNDTLQTSIFIQFGELFLKLRYRSEEIKLPLSEIEKM